MYNSIRKLYRILMYPIQQVFDMSPTDTFDTWEIN